MPISVFTVEDNKLVLQALTEALEEATAVNLLGNATDAKAAIIWLQSHRGDWQLLLVDLFLSRGTGLEVVAECQGRNVGQKVVVVTNYATPDIRARAICLGADAVFDKSTELEELLEYCVRLSGTLSP